MTPEEIDAAFSDVPEVTWAEMFDIADLCREAAAALAAAEQAQTRLEQDHRLMEQYVDEARAYGESKAKECDTLQAQLEHRTLTLGAEVRKREQAERACATLREERATAAAGLLYALALMRGRLDVEAPTNRAIIERYISAVAALARVPAAEGQE